MCRIVRCLFVFFFRQKTADDMRISDWSSDVCSSDLLNGGWCYQGFKATPASGWCFAHTMAHDEEHELNRAFSLDRFERGGEMDEIGRASCRERVCQDV